MFGVTGEGCGCVSMNVSGDTTSVTCSGWIAGGQTCSFEVRTLSQDCGFTSDPVIENLLLTGELYIRLNTVQHIILYQSSSHISEQSLCNNTL